MIEYKVETGYDTFVKTYFRCLESPGELSNYVLRQNGLNIIKRTSPKKRTWSGTYVKPFGTLTDNWVCTFHILHCVRSPQSRDGPLSKGHLGKKGGERRKRNWDREFWFPFFYWSFIAQWLMCVPENGKRENRQFSLRTRLTVYLWFWEKVNRLLHDNSFVSS